MFIEQLPVLLDYVGNLPGIVCLVGDMNIHFDNPLQSLTKQNLTAHSLGAHWSSGKNVGFRIQRLTVQIPTSVCCVLEQDTLSALLQSTQL